VSGTLLFGGSFDPIHHGHLIVARSAAEQLGIGRIVLVPSALPPHKQHVALAPAELRLEMCRLAVSGDRLFEVSEWELGQRGPNYTLHTVRHFRAVLGPDEALYWLIGLDSLVDLPTWFRVRELAEVCTLVTAVRPGVEPPDLEAALGSQLSVEQIERLRRHILPTPLIEIAATDIRARVRGGRSIRYLTPDAVADAIAAHGLYRTGG
jgi:nicotinate-nucleotide adenylyltransferase